MKRLDRREVTIFMFLIFWPMIVDGARKGKQAKVTDSVG